ncbi:MAG: hypothetical protein ACOYEH_06020 [Caldicoprobacterales bacterium]|jgi:hypothetical protein|nr:hypothetical protein [Clostridiales bacterium]
MKKTEFPRIHLAIDNCFAIKRWVEPYDWMHITKELGDIRLIQASTDNEIDPSHNTEDFRDYWIKEVKKYEKELDLKVFSFYSGYATYRTAGIASLHESKRQAMIDKYFKPVVDVACRLNAQVGNSLSAFSDPVLQDPLKYELVNQYLENSLISMTQYAADKGVTFSYEQMYTPTQGMWTINGCIDCMRNVYSKAKSPMYTTIDTAHSVGQSRFLKPSVSQISQMQKADKERMYYLPEAIQELIVSGQDPNQIYESLDKYDYWFAEPADTDVYEWFSKLGCYSPTVHLQQTDGTYSLHKPFTAQNNEKGIIEPRAVFEAISKSYIAPSIEGMPPKVKDIYLVFEIFYSVTDTTKKIIDELKESIAYWRQYLPRDGMKLDELI